jgi:hypothetical protein
MKDKNALLRYFTVDLVIWALVKFSIGLSQSVWGQSLNRYVLCMVMAGVLYLAAYGLLITDEVKASKINQPRFRMASLAISFMLVSFVEKLINMI